MAIGDRLIRLLPDLSAVLARFPIPVLIAALLCLYLNIQAAAESSSPDFETILAGAAGFMAAGAAHLFAESRRWMRGPALLLALAAGAGAAALAYFGPRFETVQLFLFAGLLSVLTVAAYLRPGAKQGALWLFNLKLGLAALLAVVVTVVFAGGLSAIVESLNFLFETRISNDLHEHIWASAASLVAPVYGLALMPKDLDEEVAIGGDQNALLERGVSVLVNYVLVPIVAVYALILHAYALKIALQWRLPEGQLGTMVSIFALGGTAAWLVAWPWRETGTKLLRLFMRGWFWLTIVPAALLVIAVWRRIADYGVTPERYGVALIALWLAAVTAYLAYRRNRADMRAIVGAFAVLTLLGAVGPWGANGLTIASQFSRLTALAEAQGIVKDGKAVRPPPAVADAVRTQGTSMIEALRQADGLDRLRPWFEGETGDPFATGETGWALSAKIGDALGMSYNTPAVDAVSFTAQKPAEFSTGPGPRRVIGPLRLITYLPAGQQPADRTAVVEGDAIIFHVDGRQWTYPMRDLLEKAKAAYAASPDAPQALTIDIGGGATLLVDSCYGTLGEKPQVNSGVVWLVVGK